MNCKVCGVKLKIKVQFYLAKYKIKPVVLLDHKPNKCIHSGHTLTKKTWLSRFE